MGQRDGETSGQEVKGQDPPGGEGSAPGGQGGGLPFAESLLGPPQSTHVPRGTGTKKNLRTRITQLVSGRTSIQIWTFSCQRPSVCPQILVVLDVKVEIKYLRIYG